MGGGRVSAVADFRSAFRLDTWRGKVAALTAVLTLVAPSLVAFVSPVFLVLLGVALVLSLATLTRVVSDRGEASSRLARAGYAMAVNGVLLIVGLFFVGVLGDFVLEARQGLVSTSVGLGFTTVHILLGIGLLVVDDYRHSERSDL